VLIHVELVLEFVNSVGTLLQRALHFVDLVSESFPICIVRSAELLRLGRLLVRSSFLLFKLSQFVFHFFLPVQFFLQADTVELLHPELFLLEVLKGRRQLAQILADRLVLKVGIIQFFPVLVQVVGHRLVTLVDVEFSANPVVLLVQEVNLVLQLLRHLLVRFLLVLHVQSLQVLPTLVELAKPQNFCVSCFNLPLVLFYTCLKFVVALDEFVVSDAHFLRTFVSPSQLGRPLMLVGRAGSELSGAYARWTFI